MPIHLIKKTTAFLLIFLLVGFWFYSDLFRIYNFPPQIKTAQALQFGRPATDISTGSWSDATGGNNNGALWDEIDESTASDTDYIQSSNSPSADAFEVSLGTLGDPLSSTGHTVRVRERMQETGGGQPANVSLTIQLKEGSTVIASQNYSHGNNDTGYYDRVFTLTGVQADSISDYTNLRINISATQTGGARVGRLEVTWAELELPNAPPSITAVTDSPDPVNPGSSINFSVDWNDPNDQIKVKICKTNSLTNQNCTGGVWASSTSFAVTDPRVESYTTLTSDAGSNNYYAFVCDDEGACSASNSGTFYVNSLPTISTASDSPDPILVSDTLTFSIDWSDSDAGENIKAKVCQTNSLTNQNCDGGAWASSTSFTTSDPETLNYVPGFPNTGSNNYYIFVCDDDANCSASSWPGTFFVQNKPGLISVEDSPDPIIYGNNISFSSGWTDNDPSENVKSKICKTDSLTNQNCDGGAWASSTSFTVSNPEVVAYTTLIGDLGTQQYYAFICDDDTNCSFSLSGTFDVVTGNFNTYASSSVSFDSALPVEFFNQTSTLSDIGSIMVEDDRDSTPGWNLTVSGNDWKYNTGAMQLDYDEAGSDNDLGKMCIFPNTGTTLYANVGSLTGLSKGANSCYSSLVSVIDVVTASTGNGHGTYWLTDLSLEQYFPSNPTAQVYTTTVIFTVQ